MIQNFPESLECLLLNIRQIQSGRLASSMLKNFKNIQIAADNCQH